MGRMPADVATPMRFFGGCDAGQTTAAGGVQAEKQRRYVQLIAQGVNNSEACRLLGAPALRQQSLDRIGQHAVAGGPPAAPGAPARLTSPVRASDEARQGHDRR